MQTVNETQEVETLVSLVQFDSLKLPAVRDETTKLLLKTGGASKHDSDSLKEIKRPEAAESDWNDGP